MKDKCEMCGSTINQFGDEEMFEVDNIPDGKIWVCGTGCAFSILGKALSEPIDIDEVLKDL